MKSFYILATSVLFISLTFNASAQTYTAVRTGNWAAAPGPNFVWDVNGQPPSPCNNCLITIKDGVTVTLNTSVELNQNSVLNIGTSGATTTSIVISSAGGASISAGNNILLDYNGVTNSSSINLVNNNASVNAQTAGTYDGVFASNSGFSKLVGNAPSNIEADGTTIQFPGNAIYGNDLVGAASGSTLSSSTILPVSLVNFEAAGDNDVIKLTWTTLMENNSSYFDVQRLAPNGNWVTIGKVGAQGNSSVAVNYSFTDQSPIQGVNQYRLQAVDRDDRYSYSEVKLVHLGNGVVVNLFPNPANDFVNVSFKADATGTQRIRLISQTGQLLVERTFDNAAGTIVSLPVSNYPQGNYLVVVIGEDGSRQTTKLLISHQ